MYLFNFGKILYGSVKNKGRERINKDGVEVQVGNYKNYSGSSKGMFITSCLSFI